jgi:hypothetical protein
VAFIGTVRISSRTWELLIRMINNEIILTKFKRLLEKVYDYPPHCMRASEDEDDPGTKDLIWIRGMIDELLNDMTPRRIDLMSANHLWKKYTDTNFETNPDWWARMDEELKEGRKINAIKLYRDMFNCNLRVAKNAIDARQIVLDTS